MADRQSLSLRHPKCSICRARATWEVRAQWTLFDAGEWHSCDDHLEQIQVYLSHRQVDNQLPQRIEVVDIFLDPLGLPFDEQDR
jgi:hypothetical protein